MRHRFNSKPFTSSWSLKAKHTLCLGLCVLLSNAPQVGLANVQMISNQEILVGSSKSMGQEDIQSFLNQDEVLSQLKAFGISAEEAKSRVAALSPAELQQFSTQMQEARAGGSILVTVVLVLLIVFLVQRI